VADASRGRTRTYLIWAVLSVVVAVPIGAAAFSPLLAWREPVYIAAGFAGVIAMWAVFGAALWAVLLRRRRLRWWIWRLGHTSLALVNVAGSVVHAVLIEGTMETATKALLCLLVVAATTKVLVDLRVWTTQTRRKAKS
jgi:hypothetical protein